MLEFNKEYLCTVSDTTILGAGVCKIDNFIVFVSGCIKGDVCRIKIRKIKKNYAFGECIELLEKSPYRIESDCASFTLCGGCSHRCASYEYETELKTLAVSSALSKFGFKEDIVCPLISAGEHTPRNKASFHFDVNGTYGFYSEDTNSVVDISKNPCKIVPDSFNKIANFASEFFQKLKFELEMRISSSDEISVCLTGINDTQLLGKFVMSAVPKFPVIVGVSYRKNAKDKFSVLYGNGKIETYFANCRFRISPEAFFQVNYECGEKLMETVLSYASECNFTRCADLYCGTGTIGIILAKHFPLAKFTGVEINRFAISDAKYNAKLNEASNIKFICSDAAGSVAANENAEKFELVILDPPRRGLSDFMIQDIRKMMPDNIIYVSCNPFTMARDASKLREFGYEPKKATPVNMFPRSSHVEVVCLFIRKDNV